MGMNYDMTFHNATIKPERYGALIDWAPEDVAAEPEKAAEQALTVVSSLLDEWTEVQQDESGIILDGDGFHGSAGYGYTDELFRLLHFCEPGAYIHEIESESGTGEQWRHILTKSGRIVTIEPTLTWPEVVEA